MRTVQSIIEGVKSSHHRKFIFSNTDSLSKRIIIIIIGLFVITGISLGQTTRTWDGGGTNDRWTNADNWSDNTLPQDDDNVIIPLGFNNLTITRVPTIILNSFSVFSTGVTLTARTSAQTITISNSSASVNISGSLTLGGGDITNAVNLVLSSFSSSTISGSLTIEANASLTLASNRTLSISGSVINNGTFTANNTGSTVIYNGSIAQSVVSTAYNNLTFSNTGIASLSGNTSVNGNCTINNGATLYCGNSNIAGTGSFTLVAGGTLAIGSSAGITTSGASGNIQVTGSRPFSNQANYIYNGTAPQVTGSGLPSAVKNLTISNSNGVTMSNDITVGGLLSLSSGVLNTSGHALNISNSAAGSLSAIAGTYINGTFSRAMANAGGAYVFPAGSSSCGSHWLTFSNISGTNPVIKVTFSCSGATTADNTTITQPPLGINWHLEKASGTFSDASAELAGSEIEFTHSMAHSAAQSGTYSRVLSTPATGSVLADNIGSIDTDTWLGIGTSVVKTYYSYQSGSWNSATTWTTDPSGTTQVGSTIPGDGDVVEILSGRTVTLPGNISTTGLSVTINAGGSLDLSTYQFLAGLNELAGQGTLIISSDPAVFPTPVTTNSFVEAGGGTTEYRSGVTLPSQSTYNNLCINASGLTVTQTINLTLNGDLHVKAGTFRINDNTSRRLQLTVNGNTTVDNLAFLTVGSGTTNSTTNPVGITTTLTPPFIDYYYNQSHTIILKGNFTNNGTVRFTNQTYPAYNAFPSDGFATVYFQGTTNNTLLCAGKTDFYNIVVDKGTDQTYKLTLYTSVKYSNFRLFGANNADFDQFGASSDNPNIKKALWIRNGILELQGTTVFPSLSEGTSGTPTYYYIPKNGALVLNGVDVIVQTTSDNYKEVNAAYGTSLSDNTIGITQGTGNGFCLFGRLELDNGYFSTKESEGIITTSAASGQLIINKGTIDTKQFFSQTGSASSFEQNGGTFILRGRFQRTPDAFSSATDLAAAQINTVRANDGCLTAASGTFSMNNATNVFTMSGGTMQIFDVCGAAATTAFQAGSSSANMNVTGGTILFTPTAGTGGTADVSTHLVSTTTPLGNVTINRAGSSTVVQLSTALNVLGNMTITSGAFSANNLDLTIGGNFYTESGTTYTPGTNTTILNGSGVQTFTVNLASALSINNFTINKPAGVAVNMAGSQTSINVLGNFNLTAGTLNDNGDAIYVAKNVYNSGIHTGTGKISLNGTAAQTIDGAGVFQNLELDNTTSGNAAPVSLLANTTVNGVLSLVSSKIFNIGTYNLAIGTSGSISATFNNSCYIHSAGNSGDGGITKTYSSNDTFTFPVGCYSANRPSVFAYAPATIGFSSSPATYGSITVIPVGYEHPATTVNGQSLTFYWRVKSTGFTGYGNKVTHSFVYSSTDINGTIGNYIPSLFSRTNSTWNNGLHANINTGTYTISDWTTPTNSPDFLDADYTAGDNTTSGGCFGSPKVYYSLASGLWSANSTWTFNSSHTGAQAGSVPGVNDVVIIGNNHTITLTNGTYGLNTASVKCASLRIDAGATLDIENNSSSVFSTVVSSPLGNGKFRLTTTKASPFVNNDISTFIFPSGDFSDFNVNKGTTEFYTTTGTTDGSTLYILPSISYVGNMLLSPLGNASSGDNMVLPNVNSLTIFGDLTLNGATAYSAIGLSWNTNNTFYGHSALYSTVEKTVHVNGNMYVNGGSFTYFDDNQPQHLIVDGNLNIASSNGACVLVWDRSFGYTPYNNGPTLNNTLAIGGNLINNGTAKGVFDGLNLFVDSSTPHYCDVTFQGSDNATIEGTGNINFHNVTVNKGSSQATTLDCTTSGILSTPDDNWLTLQNGTFKYERTNPAAGENFTISTSSTFSIPSTAGLYVNMPGNTNNINILIANNSSNSNDVYLGGSLTVVKGNVYIGPVNGTTNNNNDIEYAGAGSPKIEVDGGILVVNGQVRRSPSITSGALNYIQTGGTVTINGNASN
ncbi:MAG TPA: hypothetical protein PLR88_05575, partial [Bacteroidales bacterium]|nr:hypothetical protein [Bacteroidales bacterium]